MSDAVRCPKCGFVYAVGSYDNWGTCTNCNSNNDRVLRKDCVPVGPLLVDFTYLHTKISKEKAMEIADKDT